jgi:uncharacterized protein
VKKNGSRFEVTPGKITRVARRIVSKFHPEKVILFGSWARGDARPDSDVDLLVVMPANGSKRAQQMAILGALHGIIMATDIVVVTPQEFADYADAVGTIVRPAVREGKVLYARS